MTFSLVFMFSVPSHALVEGDGNKDGDLLELQGSVLGWQDTVSVPVPDHGLLFQQISTHSNAIVGLDTEEKGWGWGLGGNGNLGAFNMQTSRITQPQPLIESAEDREIITGISLTASSTNSFYIDHEGLVWGYGKNSPQNGEIGNPSAPEKSYDAVAVVTNNGEQLKAEKVYGGEQYAIAIDGSGYTYSWGQDLSGRLGRDPYDVPSNVAAPVVDEKGKPQRFSSVALGYSTVLALDEQGNLWGWGKASNGLLGPSNTKESYSTPQQVFLDKAATKPARFESISLADEYVLALDSSNAAWAWGKPGKCPVLGIANEKPNTAVQTPAPVVDDQGKQAKFTQVAASLNSPHVSSGLDKDGHVWTWGCADYLGRDSSSKMGMVLDADQKPIEATGVYEAQNTSFATLKDPVGTGPQAYNVVGWGTNDLGVLLGNPEVASGEIVITPVPVRLPAPPYEGIVYFGDDDTVGQKGITAEGVMTVQVPDHKAGRIPIYVSWPQLGVERELIGYYTYMLDPTISVNATSQSVGKTAVFTVTLPEAERDYVGDSELVFESVDHPALNQTVQFQDGTADISYEGTKPETVEVTAIAMADAGQTVVSPSLNESTEFVGSTSLKVEEGYQDKDGNFVDLMDAMPGESFPVSLKISNDDPKGGKNGLMDVQIAVQDHSEVQLPSYSCNWDSVQTEDGAVDGINYGSSVMCRADLTLESGQTHENTVTVTATDVVTHEQVSASDSFRAKALIGVTPEAPTENEVSCGIIPELQIPQIEGVDYKVTVINSDTFSKDIHVEAVAQPGYVLVPGDVQSSWDMHLEATECPITPPPGPGTGPDPEPDPDPDPNPVMPLAPSLLEAACGERPVVNLPFVEGVQYSTSQDGDKVTVTAKAEDGYTLTEGSETRWVLDTKITPCEVEKPLTKPGSGLASTGAAIGSLTISVITFAAGFALLMVSRRKTQ